MDLDQALGNAVVSTRRHPVFLCPFFIRVTNPALYLFDPVTPKSLIRPLIPLYVAWLFFLIRFHLMLWVLGYTVMGMLSFSLENEFVSALDYFVGLLVN
jgi:hypothetical protein